MENNKSLTNQYNQAAEAIKVVNTDTDPNSTIINVDSEEETKNPSIGIVLCKSANKEYVEFVIQDYNKPMGVATYTTSEEMPEKLRNALPDIEELKKLL